MLTLNEVEVGRAPGFTWNRFPRIENLGPGLNVVWGPNGAGKSTLARTLRGLLWPCGDASTEAVAMATVDGATWRLERRGRDLRQTRQQDRHESQAQWGGAEQAERHWFSLPELLGPQAPESRFTDYILSQMHGGGDLRAACASAGGLDRPLSGNNREVQAHKAATAQRKALLAQHESQKELRSQLRAGEEAMEAARNAASRLLDVKRAMALLEAGNRREEAARHLASFPEAIAGLSEDAPLRVQEWESQKQTLDLKSQERQTALKQKRREIGDLGLTAEFLLNPAPAAQIQAWSEELRRLEPLCSAARQASDQADAAESAWREQLQWLLPTPPVEAALRPMLQRLRELARQCEPRRCALEAAQRWVKSLGAPEPSQPVDTPERWQELQTCLKEWQRQTLLAQPGPPSVPGGRVPLAAAAALVLILAALALAKFVAPTWALLSLGVPVVVWGLLRPQTPGASPEAEQAAGSAREYETRVQHLLENWPELQPEAGTPEARQNLLSEAACRMGRAQARLHQDQTRQTALAALAEATQAQAAWVKDWQEAASALGLRADQPDLQESQFFNFASSLQDWLGLIRTAAEARAAWEGVVRTRDAALRALQASIASAGDVGPASGAPALLAQAQELLGRREAALRLRVEEQAVIQQLQTLGEDMVDLMGKLDRFWQGCGFLEPDEPRLQAWAAQVADRRRATLALEAAEAEVATLALDPAAALAQDRNLEDLQALARHLEAEAATLEQRSTAFGEQRKRYQDLLDGEALAQAMAQEARERQALEEAQRENTLGRIVHLLTHELEEKAFLEEQPPVLNKANAWLQRFTQNRYTLGMRADRIFFARDQIQNRTLDLEELSSGTRIQLLFAVRLGFIDELEGGIPLPIFLDEVLAHSDDERAEAMILALREIARDRQVFYFTAQRNELAKLEGLACPFKAVALGELDLAQELERQPLRSSPPPDAVPEACPDYAAFGRACQAPGASLFSPLANLHLWHLFTRSEDLRGWLLRGLRRVGQIKGAAVTDTTGLRPRLALLERAQHLAQQGRPRPLDPEALEQSAIEGVNKSAAYWVHVMEAARKAAASGSAFLESLEDVPRLREEQREAIGTWLLAQDMLSSEEPLDAEGILTRLGLEFDALRVGSEDRVVVERYVHSILL